MLGWWMVDIVLPSIRIVYSCRMLCYTMLIPIPLPACLHASNSIIRLSLKYITLLKVVKLTPIFSTSLP